MSASERLAALREALDHSYGVNTDPAWISMLSLADTDATNALVNALPAIESLVAAARAVPIRDDNPPVVGHCWACDLRAALAALDAALHLERFALMKYDHRPDIPRGNRWESQATCRRCGKLCESVGTPDILDLDPPEPVLYWRHIRPGRPR